MLTHIMVDIVLTDDNFASIIAAIQEGRRSFDNIKAFALHLLAGNVGQAMVLLIGLAFKDNQRLSVFPLSPGASNLIDSEQNLTRTTVEVLWVVVVTSGPPAMGLGMQDAAADIMRRPPHNARRGILTNGTSWSPFIVTQADLTSYDRGDPRHGCHR